MKKTTGRFAGWISLLALLSQTVLAQAAPDEDWLSPSVDLAAYNARQQELEDRFGRGPNPEAVARVEAGELTAAIASWWGFDADDATETLQAAIDSGVPVLFIPNLDAPWTVGRTIRATRDNQTLFFETGARLLAREGAFLHRRGILFKIMERENVRLLGYGAVFAMRKQDYTRPPYGRSPHRHGLSIRGGRNIEVLGLEIRETGGDGIYVAGTHPDRRPPERIFLRDLRVDDNHRQGLSVISVRGLRVENSIFSNTSGTAPMAGIDLEPNNPKDMLVDIVIRNCKFLNNHRLGMHNWLRHMGPESEPVSILWENNYVSGGELGIHVGYAPKEGPGGVIRFRNNVVTDTRGAGIILRRISAESGLRIEFENNVLYNTATAGLERYGADAAPIVLSGQTEDIPLQGGIRFFNDLVVQDRPGPAVLVTGPDVGFEGWFDAPEQEGAADARTMPGVGWVRVSGNVRVLNPHGIRMEKRTHTDEFTLIVEPPPHSPVLEEVLGRYIALRSELPLEIEDMDLVAADRVRVRLRSHLAPRAIPVSLQLEVQDGATARERVTLEPGEVRDLVMGLGRPLEGGAQVRLTASPEQPDDWSAGKADINFSPIEYQRRFDFGRIQVVPAMPGGIEIDGDLSEWATRPHLRLRLDQRHLQGAPELGGLQQADLYLGWDSEYLYLAVDAADAAHHNDRAGGSLLRGDSLQFALVSAAPAEHDVLNLAVARASGESQAHVFVGPERGLLEPGDFRVHRDDAANRTRYEIRLPFSHLPVEPKMGSVFGFNAVLFEHSGGRRYDYWLQLTPGLAGGFDSAPFLRFMLAR